tara:strand:+ start:3160 stop:4161 length:1002 start_codon:yes stop_codon:yes gene_type:complete
MALPTQLQEQVDNAKIIAEQVYGPNEGSSNKEVSTESEDSSQDTSSTESETQEVASANENRTTPDTDENNNTYAQRWRSLQGVYNAQKRQLDDTTSRLSNMEQLLTQMQSAPAAQDQRASHVTDKDKTEYGEDMVEFARRVTREEVVPLAQAVQQLMSRIDQLQGVVPMVQQVANQQAQTTHEKFYGALSARVPDWQAVNENQRFHDWLMSADPLSGLQRQTLLTDAHNSLDLPRVVSIFDTWKRETGVAAAPAVAAKSSNVSKLERQIAPGRVSGTTPPSQADKKQWTRQDIAAFFKDKMDGKYKGKEEEARSVESDIFLAQREGRVVLNAA